MRRAALLLLLAVGLAGCDGGEPETAPEREAPSGDVFARIPEIVDEVQPSVVAVFVQGGEGSGVIMDEEGLIVTNAHVVGAARRVDVQLATGERLPAEVQATDEFTDLAVLQVERTGLPAAEFAEDLPDVGELAVAMGNPFGLENSVTAGIVSGLNRAIPSGGQTPALVDLIQTDAPISPGNSGGALVDGDGRVIGINVAFIPPEARAVSLGFAIPAPTVTSVARQLIEKGEAQHAFLGILVAPVTPQLSQSFGLGVDHGVLVREVGAGSPADEAGLRRGDVIVGFADRDIQAPEDLFAELRDHEPGDTVQVTIVRGGERRSLELTLGERPSE